jgi:paraquat-inducible protein B
VTLLGFTVGEVRSTQVTTDADSGTVSTTAIIDLDPTRFHLEGTQPASDQWRVRLDAALNQLIRHGLRARLDKSPPLVGSQQIVLDVKQPSGAAASQTAALLTQGVYPQIPASSGGGLEQIEDNVRAVTAQVKTLVSSSQLAETIAHLERASAGIEKVVKSAGPQVAPTLESTRHTVDELQSAAGEIEAAAGAVRKTVGGGAVAPNGNMQEAVHELTGAARSVRTLANYLDQHPEALIKGRTE